MNNSLLQSIDTINQQSDHADIAVVESILQCYSKSLNVLEGCDDTTDLSSFDIFQESFKDDLKGPVLGSKDESVGKRILMALPRLIAKLVELIRKALSNLKKSDKECEKKGKEIEKTLNEIPEQSPEKELPTSVDLEIHYKPNDIKRDYVHMIHLDYKHIEKLMFEQRFNLPEQTDMALFLKILNTPSKTAKIKQYLDHAYGMSITVQKVNESFDADKIRKYFESMLDESDNETMGFIIHQLEEELSGIKSMLEQKYETQESSNMIPRYAVKERNIDREKGIDMPWKFYSPDDINKVINYVSALVKKLTVTYDQYRAIKKEDLDELERGAKILRGEK